jgi:hypothetical protein
MELRLPEVPAIDQELGNLPTVPGDAGLPADSLYRGVPQLTAVDPSLQHANSTDRVFFGHDRG